MPGRRRLRAAPVLVVLAIVAACSGDDSEGAATTTTAAVTTTAAEASGAAYSEPGPYPVGVTTLALPSGPAVEVWYPAAADGGGEVSYDARDFVPEAIRELLTSDVPVGVTIDADRDAPASPDGPFPLVLWSHGFACWRLCASILTSHVASHGFVVMAPDHPSRDLMGALSGTIGQGEDSSPDELLATLELAESEAARPGSVLEGVVDSEQVAAVGHSAGGGTILALASTDPRVDGYVSMASGMRRDDDEPAPTLPDVPSLFMAGALDGVVSPARTRAAFEAAPSPSTYWEIAEAGHNAFDDLCTFGGGSGIIGLAEEAGLGDFLDSQPRFRAIGEDGCIPPAAPVTDAFPIVQHGITAWLRTLFGIDPEPVGMGQADLAVQPLAVTVAER